jgi:hypothetical protein
MRPRLLRRSGQQREEQTIKIVVIVGTGLVSSKLVKKLREMDCQSVSTGAIFRQRSPQLACRGAIVRPKPLRLPRRCRDGPFESTSK